MNCYRVVIFDENQKVLISKIVTDEGPKEIIAVRIRAIIDMHGASFAVSVSDYVHDTLSVFEFNDRLHTALETMSLRSAEK